MMIYKPIVDKTEICSLIPHSGSMCLLDKVIEWDNNHIICQTMTHQDLNNPLSINGILPVVSLIEYGAQAMAVHGGLIAKESNSAIRSGYLASLRDVVLDKNNISHITTELSVEAIQLMSSQGNMIYNFCVTANNKSLVSGRATVVAIFDDY